MTTQTTENREKLLAVFTGLALYWIVARNIPGGPGDE